MRRKPDIAPGEPFYITEEGLARLREKLSHLERVLPEYIAETQRTAAYGDRSENAEYKEAKSILRRTQGSIYRIQDQIRAATIIKPGAHNSGAVHIGSTVTLEADGIKKIFRILDSHESDPARGLISYKSPLGAALLNHQKGDVVTVETKTSKKEYRILEIK